MKMEEELCEGNIEEYIGRDVSIVGQVASCVFRSKHGEYDIKLVHGDSWIKVILKEKCKVGSVVRIFGGTLVARNAVNGEDAIVRELKSGSNDYDSLERIRSTKRAYIFGSDGESPTSAINRTQVRVTSISQLSESSTELGLQVHGKKTTALCQNFTRKEIDQVFELGKELTVNVNSSSSKLVIDKASNLNLFDKSHAPSTDSMEGFYSILALTNNKFPSCVVKVCGTVVGFTPSDLGDWFESEAFTLVISDQSDMRLRVRFSQLPHTIRRLRSEDELRARLAELGTTPHVYQCKITTTRRDMEYSVKVEGLDITQIPRPIRSTLN
ncbi:hypothetical protein TRVA0_024S01002 [Trichomonascus vanleenenianus]|uniref:uncharacterized protein n=1 Tax=Trichomonascus vanleenenianus TaxID=2268995 RepID=UPI003EC979D8